MLAKLVIATTISVLLHFIVKWLARMMPAEPEVDLSEVPPEMIARAATRMNRFGTLTALLLFFILCPAWIVGAWALEPLARPAVAEDELIVVTMPAWRLGRGMVAAYVLAALGALWLARLRFGRSYYSSMAAGNQAYGFRASRFFYFAIVWALPFCIEYELHSIGTYALFTKRGHIESTSLLWPATERPWNTLASIELVQPFNENRAAIGRPAECRLTFDDGHRFTDQPWVFPFHPGGPSMPWAKACQWIASLSGKPLQVVARID